MFFPFKDYKKVTFSSETEGAAQLKYTTTSKSMLFVSYAGSVAPGIMNAYAVTGSTQRVFNSVNLSGSVITESGVGIYWANNNPLGAETITLHIFELPL